MKKIARAIILSLTITVVQAQSYLELDGAFGEYSLNALGTTASDDVSGFRILGGIGFADTFSLDGRYETVETSDDIAFDEFRLLWNYQQEIFDGFSILGGFGYGWRSIDFAGLAELEGDGFILNAGVKFYNGPVFGGLIYTHVFSQSVDLTPAGPPLEETDLGALELMIGYDLTEQLSATYSIETQVYGDTFIEKDWMASFGLRFKF